MSSLNNFESITINKVGDILKNIKKEMSLKQIEISEPTFELTSSENRTSEIRIFIYKNSQIIDCLEFFVYKNNEFVLKDEDLSSWLFENIEEIVRENSE